MSLRLWGLCVGAPFPLALPGRNLRLERLSWVRALPRVLQGWGGVGWGCGERVEEGAGLSCPPLLLRGAASYSQAIIISLFIQNSLPELTFLLLSDCPQRHLQKGFPASTGLYQFPAFPSRVPNSRADGHSGWSSVPCLVLFLLSVPSPCPRIVEEHEDRSMRQARDWSSRSNQMGITTHYHRCMHHAKCPGSQVTVPSGSLISLNSRDTSFLQSLCVTGL